jgi:hypothetical protein
MQADTTTLAPTDAEIEALRDAFDWDGWTCQKAAQRAFARAVLAKWGAPVPASGETETCKCCGEGSARIVVRRECDTCTSVYAGVAEHRLQKSLAAPPAQKVLLNPDMPVQELRLHIGELTTDEVLVARAAIRWANTYGITAAQKGTPCAPTP